MLPFIYPKTTENLKFASIFGVSAIFIYLIVQIYIFFDFIHNDQIPNKNCTKKYN